MSRLKSIREAVFRPVSAALARPAAARAARSRSQLRTGHLPGEIMTPHSCHRSEDPSTAASDEMRGRQVPGTQTPVSMKAAHLVRRTRWESFAPPSGCGSLSTRFPRVGAFAPTRGYRLQRLRRWGSSSGVWELATGISSRPTPARGPVVPRGNPGFADALSKSPLRDGEDLIETAPSSPERRLSTNPNLYENGKRPCLNRARFLTSARSVHP